jgi:hypothetical protein
MTFVYRVRSADALNRALDDAAFLPAGPARRYGAISASVSGSMAASLAVRSAFRS